VLLAVLAAAQVEHRRPSHVKFLLAAPPRPRDRSGGGRARADRCRPTGSNGRPITCAGVRVEPGDVVIADDDGVVVVPRELADEVARRAALIQAKDRPGRRADYAVAALPAI